MKANELRIGNLIMKDDAMFTVSGTSPRYVSYEQADFVTFNFRLEDVKPVPITSELLRRFGFICTAHDFRYENDKYLIEKWITSSDYAFRVKTSESESVMITEIEFIHQLQNLYFALTDDELQLTSEKQASD